VITGIANHGLRAVRAARRPAPILPSS